MATYRVRSRWKTESKKSSTGRGIGGTLLSAATTAINTHREDMTDFVVPNWARLSRTGFYPLSPNFEHSAHLRDAVKSVKDLKHFQLLRFTPPVGLLTYTSTRSEEPLDKIVFTVEPTKTWYTVDGNCLQLLHLTWGDAFPAHPLPTPTSAATMASLLKSKVLSKCADTNYAFGEDMAEVRETLQFIRSPFRSLRRLVNNFSRDVSRKKITSPGKHAKNVAAAWSEYRFAFRPLIRSVDDALAASADYFHKRSEDRYIRFAESMSSSARSTTGGPTTKNLPHSGYSTTSWALYVQSLRSVEIAVTVGIKVFHQDHDSFSSLIGVRGRDIPLVLWEVFPLTFLFDRFYDVSSWLRASSNFLSANVSFAGGWVSSRTTDRRTRRYSNISSSFPAFNYARPTSTKPWATETFTYSREPWVPQLSEARPPALAGRLVSSLTSTADLAAVLTTRMSRAVRSR